MIAFFGTSPDVVAKAKAVYAASGWRATWRGNSTMREANKAWPRAVQSRGDLSRLGKNGTRLAIRPTRTGF
jgi:hypothetical protein